MKNLLMPVLIILFTLCACVDDNGDDCGEYPNAPGWTAAFDNGTATMSVADYQAIVAWRDRVTQWAVCKEASR